MPILDLPNDYYELPKGKLANIVTCLEMLAKPTRALKPWQHGVTLEVADPSNLNAYRTAFRAVGEDIMWFSRLIMGDEKLRGILSNPKIDSYILKRSDETLGLLELNFEHGTHCELAFFGLVPAAIGSGFGRMVMDEAIRKAWAKPITRFWVHTCTFDAPQALPFYVRSGFTPYTRMIEIHDDPRVTGNLPAAASPNVPIIGS
jgi:GNAT superfamily N-acetyltransferase